MAEEEKPKKWIHGMHLKKGALHRQLGIPEGKKTSQDPRQGGQQGRNAGETGQSS